MTTAPMTGFALHAFTASRLSEGERLYAVADAARNRELAFAARDRFRLPMQSLFTKATVREMEKVAPYLITMSLGSKYPYPGSGYLDLWAGALGTSGGILLLTEADEDALWSHLRQVFRVTDEDGGRYYFRFYDPRVLRTFLPTCTAAEAQEFFGPVRMILVESQRPRQLLVCRPGHRGAVVAEFPLTERSQQASEAL